MKGDPDHHNLKVIRYSDKFNSYRWSANKANFGL